MWAEANTKLFTGQVGHLRTDGIAAQSVEHITLVPLFSPRGNTMSMTRDYVTLIAAAAAETHTSVWKLFKNRKLQAKGQSSGGNWAGPAVGGRERSWRFTLAAAQTCVK